jgi:hypothetical protein
VDGLIGVAATIIGVAMVALAGRDAFDALFHPEGRATFARLIARAVWRAFRRAGPGHPLFVLGGPVALVAVIATWAGLLIVGWALIFWPHMPDGFQFQPGVESAGSDLVHALNVSLVTLTTLGFGDITPKAEALRLIVPLEALIGFGLLTASISWLLLIYPVLARRRSLAYEIWLLHAAESDTGLAADRLEPAAAERIYADLTSRLVAVERDLVNFPITYYFEEGDARFSLPAVAPYVLELARRGTSDGTPDRLRLRADLLLRAVCDLGRTAAKLFHGDAEGRPDDMLRAYARDHLRA